MRGERGISVILILIAFLMVAGAIAGGVTAYVVTRAKAHAPEQTAKLVPENTQLYFSLNLRPGADQSKKFLAILERFRKEPDFQDRIDDLLQKGEDQTGIDLMKEVIPWLGPEIGVAVIDVVGAAIGSITGGVPLAVALLGTTDSAASSEVLRDWVRYQEDQQGLKFDKDTYKSVTIFSEEEGEQAYAVTSDYVVFSTDIDLLEDTIDRIQSGNVAGSLYSSKLFQQVRESLPSPRVATLYADSGSIWRDARRQLGDVVPDSLRHQLDDVVPEWAALTTSLVERGAKLQLSYHIPEALKDSSAIRSLGSFDAGRLLPADTMAAVSIALETDVDRAREQLKDLRVGDLREDLYDTLLYQLGLDISEDSTLSDALDELLERFEDSFGIDLEKDVLSWMSGEIAFALLPTNFRRISEDPGSEVVEAVALVGFDPDKRAQVADAMGEVVDFVEDQFGIRGDKVSYGGGEGMVFDLRDLTGTGAYKPGYLILGDQLAVATNDEALRQVASSYSEQAGALAGDAEYSRLLKEASGARNILLYANLRALIDGTVETLDEYEREEYQGKWEPFVQPLKALFLTAGSNEEVGTVGLIVTIQ